MRQQGFAGARGLHKLTPAAPNSSRCRLLAPSVTAGAHTTFSGAGRKTGRTISLPTTAVVGSIPVLRDDRLERHGRVKESHSRFGAEWPRRVEGTPAACSCANCLEPTALSATWRARNTSIRSLCTGSLGGVDVLVNNASSLGPTPLALLADTECEQLELALATNLVGPFRLSRALLGALSASARQGRGAVILNVISDAAINPYPQWGAYGASKAVLLHLSRIWDAELASDEMLLRQIDAKLADNHYRTHEFGDSVFIERDAGSMSGRVEDTHLPNRAVRPGRDPKGRSWD
jgi:short chain dehydrogenase